MGAEHRQRWRLPLMITRAGRYLEWGVRRSRICPVGPLASAMSYLDSSPALADTYVTNIFGADAVQSGFEMAAVPVEGRLKVVLTTS
jgi:hypothetical protein